MIDFIGCKKYIISLPKRSDRRAAILAQYEKMWFKNYEIFTAIDGKDLEYRGRLKKGQVGCRLSHLEIIKSAKLDNLDHVIIIEDDAEFIQGFSLRFSKIANQIPQDWQMLYFGAHNFRQLKMISENIGRCVTSLSTVCYAVRNTLYDTLIKELQRDEILDLIYVNRVHPKFDAYCVYPNLVIQKSGYSDIENGYINYKNFYNKW